MGKIYINQPFKITTTVVEDVNGVETPVNITGLPVSFFYIDPDGIELELTPGVITNPTGGEFEYDVLVDTLTKEGRYTFWGVVVFGNGEVPAEPTELTLYARGK